VSRSAVERTLVAAAIAVMTGLLAAVPAAAAATHAAAGKADPWTVLSGRDGSTLLWTGRLPAGDARPTFAMNGHPLGTPLGGVAGRPYQLVLPGVHGIQTSALSVQLSGRALGTAGRSRLAAPGAVTSLPDRPTALVSPDPGVPGPYRTAAYSYQQPGLSIDGLPVPVEVVGQVVAPVGAAGARPVALILHGRHGTCFRDTEVSSDWPCQAGYQPVPSLQGYRYVQELLASRGYVTVSVAANGINGQDGDLIDAGAHARSVLIRHHLSLLAKWNTTPGPGAVAGLRGHLDLRRVMLVGHSRGGEGVARAAIDARTQDPFRIVGQVLIAPTDFGREVAVGIPTTVLLPYCDGDVSDLQGQQYLDQSRGLATGDHALVSSAMVFGADHNFFNTEWTPGLSKAPASDDWSDSADPVCGASAQGRLTPSHQRSAGATYIAAAADSYLSNSRSAVSLLDGSKVRAASAGPATVLVQALGGSRQALLSDPTSAALSTAKGLAATVCAGFTPDGTDQCLTDGSGASPHWLRGDIPSTNALRVGWTKTGGTATVSLPATLDVSHQRYLDARIVADASHPRSGLSLVLTDSAGRSAAVDAGSVVPLPGSIDTRKLWATTVRVPLRSFTGIDQTHLRTLGFRATSSSGLLYVLDAFAAEPGQIAGLINPRTLPRFDVTSPDISLPPDDQLHDIAVTLSVAHRVRVPAQLWVVVQGGAQAPGGNPEVTSLTVAPGSHNAVVHVQVRSSSVFSSYPDRVLVAVYARKDAVVGKYVGGGAVVSHVPPPTLQALSPNVDVRQGDTIRWTLRLSAPTRYGFYSSATAVATTTGAELTTRDVLRDWVLDHTTTPSLPDGSPAPLSQAGASVAIGFEALSTTYTLELPTAATSASPDSRVVAFDVAADGVILPTALRLTATIHPSASPSPGSARRHG
jgi:hypothetical protein